MDLLEQISLGPKYKFKDFDEVVRDVFYQLSRNDREMLVDLRLRDQLTAIYRDWELILTEMYMLDDFNNPYFVLSTTSILTEDIVDAVVDLCEEAVNGL